MNGCKVTGCGSDNTIPASELKEGQVAVIIRNGYSSTYNGRIVARCLRSLMQLGCPALFSSDFATLTGDKCRVRVLKAGEQITVS